MELKGKNALITGANGIIGAAIAKALAEAGVNLSLQYRNNHEKIDTIINSQEKLGISVEALQGDLQKASDSQNLVKEYFTKNAKLDILVNCLGDFSFKPLPELSPEEFRQNINSNLNIAFDLSHFALPHLRKSAQGRILHIGYATAIQLEAKTNILPYHIAKLGLVLLTKSLAKEEASNNILVNCLSPGIVEGSKYLPKNDIPLKRPAKATEIADAALFLLQSDYITGTNLEIDGGWRGYQ
jgi:NAD(P)-dependent dehydrogenase (short-subunit alcohol dehydrogenase family)